MEQAPAREGAEMMIQTYLTIGIVSTGGLLMLIRAVMIAFLLSTAAYADDAPKPADPSPVAAPAPPTEWYLKFDQPMLNALSACIQEMPKRVADPFLSVVQGQIGGQAAIVAAVKAKP
jgi:hypothetical protein